MKLGICGYGAQGSNNLKNPEISPGNKAEKGGKG